MHGTLGCRRRGVAPRGGAADPGARQPVPRSSGGGDGSQAWTAAMWRLAPTAATAASASAGGGLLPVAAGIGTRTYCGRGDAAGIGGSVRGGSGAGARARRRCRAAAWQRALQRRTPATRSRSPYPVSRGVTGAVAASLPLNAPLPGACHRLWTRFDPFPCPRRCSPCARPRLRPSIARCSCTSCSSHAPRTACAPRHSSACILHRCHIRRTRRACCGHCPLNAIAAHSWKAVAGTLMPATTSSRPATSPRPSRPSHPRPRAQLSLAGMASRLSTHPRPPGHPKHLPLLTLPAAKCGKQVLQHCRCSELLSVLLSPALTLPHGQHQARRSGVYHGGHCIEWTCGSYCLFKEGHLPAQPVLLVVQDGQRGDIGGVAEQRQCTPGFRVGFKQRCKP